MFNTILDLISKIAFYVIVAVILFFVITKLVADFGLDLSNVEGVLRYARL